MTNQDKAQQNTYYCLEEVIVIAIFALTIYKSYMQTSDSNLKVKDDISEVRTTVRENNSILG